MYSIAARASPQMATSAVLLVFLSAISYVIAQGTNAATYYNVFPDRLNGIASNYGGPADGSNGGAMFGLIVGGCGYGNLNDPTKYPRRAALAFDPNSPAIARYKSLGCGSCWKVTNRDNQYQSLVAMVTDTCPGCNAVRSSPFAVDVDYKTWATVVPDWAEHQIGTFNAVLEQVNCQPTGNLKLIVTDFRGGWGWIRLFPFEAAGVGVVHRIQVSCPEVHGQSGPGVVELQNEWGAVWEALDKTGKFPNYKAGTQCAFLVTSAAGQTVYCYSRDLGGMVGRGGTIECDGNFDGSYSASGTGSDWRFGRKLIGGVNATAEPTAPVRSARKFLATVDPKSGVASLTDALDQ